MLQQSQDDEQSPCVMCHQQNQQMLMLSCIHDPCINCAAVHYVDNQPPHSKIYTCAICGQQTELDNTSVLELQKLYHSLRNRRKPELSRSHASNYSQKDRVNTKTEPIRNEFRPINDYKATNDITQQKNDHRYNKQKPFDNPVQSRKRNDRESQEGSYNAKYFPSQPISQPSYPINPANNKKVIYQLQYPCGDHPQEELTYFCFTCNKPICPQCAIHGSHKDHEVQTTRKAIKQIRVLLNQDKLKLQQEGSLLMAAKDRCKKQGREWNEENKSDQDFIKKKFTHFRNILIQKEKELMKIADSNLQKNGQILKMENHSSDKALQDIAKVKKSIDHTLKKEQLSILQEFNQRDEEVNQTLSKIERQKQKQQDFMSKNPPRILNFHQFQDELDRIIQGMHSLKLSTTAK